MRENSPRQLMLLDPTEYFVGMVSGAVTELRVDASEHAQFYLVRLLNHFLNSDNLYHKNSDGRLENKQPLALLLGEAVTEEDPMRRSRKLREMGDFSLYVAGFFSDSLARKPIDVDYYIGMGSRAYLELSNISLSKNDPALYQELAKKFSAFVDVLGQVSEETQAQSSNPDSILRIYNQWTKTKSKRLEKKLIDLGFNLEQSPKQRAN